MFFFAAIAIIFIIPCLYLSPEFAKGGLLILMNPEARRIHAVDGL